MRDEAIFLNGVFRDVLEEIHAVHEVLPEQILFLQPYATDPIKKLHDAPPSVDDPAGLFLSTSDNLGEIEFVAEVVGVDDKRSLDPGRRQVIERILATFQSTEEKGVDPGTSDEPQVNLLHVRRLRRLDESIPVTRLIKTSDGTPIAGARSTAGGWAYVVNVQPGT